MINHKLNAAEPKKGKLDSSQRKLVNGEGFKLK